MAKPKRTKYRSWGVFDIESGELRSLHHTRAEARRSMLSGWQRCIRVEVAVKPVA